MAGFDCCTNIQLCLLFTLNFIIWAFGLACIGVGIWALVDPAFLATIDSILSTDVAQTYNITVETVHAAAGILVAIGVITFFIAFCACCGAMKRSRCLLRIYIGVMSILLILQVTAIILMFVFGGAIDAMSQDVFKFWVQNDVRYNSTYYEGNDAVKYANEIVAQNQMEGCCGVSGPTDYINSQYYNDTQGTCIVPETCCKQNPGATWDNPSPVNRAECCKLNANYTYTNGCEIGFYDVLNFPYWMLYVVGISLFIFQIAVTYFACAVQKAIDDYV